MQDVFIIPLQLPYSCCGRKNAIAISIYFVALKSQKGVNLARTVTNDATKGAGKKGNKPPTKRYGNARNIDDLITTTIDPFTTPQTSGSSTENDSQAQLTPFEGTGFCRLITTCQGKCGRPMRIQN